MDQIMATVGNSLMRLKDGLMVWDTRAGDKEDDDPTSDEPPVLASTATLLQALRVRPWYKGALNEAIFDPMVTTSNVQEEEKKVTEDAVDAEQAEAETDPPETIDETENPRSRKNKKKTVEFTTPDWAKSLSRQVDLAQSIQTALKDVLRGSDGPKVSKKDRQPFSANQRRIGALEHQRNRLQKQKSRETPIKVKETDHESNGDDEEEEGDDDEQREEDDDMEDTPNRTVEEAWRLQMRVLNSLSILLPLLVEMFCHEQRDNKFLSIGGKTILNRRKASCWLFGRHVFDFTTRQQMEDLYAFLCRAWEVIVRQDGPQTREEWNLDESQTRLQGLMEFVVHYYNGGVSNGRTPGNLALAFSWTSTNPLESLAFVDEPHLSGTIEWTKRIDEANELFGSKVQQEQAAHNLELVKAFEKRLSLHLKRRFPSDHVRLRVYGSCLSGLTVGEHWDVDISLEMDQATALLEEFESAKIDATEFDNRRKKMVYQVCRCLEDKVREFSSMQPIARARVPVVKGKWSSKPDGSQQAVLDFDICFFNGIAYENSSLLKEYAMVDKRVAALIRLTKQWAKEYKIGSAMESCMSSYAWSNLVIFYLQAVGIVPNLQSQELMKKANAYPDVDDPDHHIKNLDTFFLRWEQVKPHWKPRKGSEIVTVTALFYGFIRFYTLDYPTSILLISIKRGPVTLDSGIAWPRLVFGKTKSPFTIEDPFETYDSHCPHDLNHADEGGLKRILSALSETEAYLSELLLSLSEQGAALPLRLWPHYESPSGQGTPRKKRNRSSKKPGPDKYKRSPTRDGTPKQKGKGPNKAKGTTGANGVTGAGKESLSNQQKKESESTKSSGRKPGRGHQGRGGKGRGRGGRGRGRD